MLKQKDTFWWFKTNAILRYTLAHLGTQLFPLYVINEYPKSGGSWVGEMLSEALNIPFPRNCFPVCKSSILHGHMMHTWNMTNVICVWRDGRDVLISQYYHYLFENEKGNSKIVEKCRADLSFKNYEDITENLPSFMTYVYEYNKHPSFTWSKFVKQWSTNSKAVHTKYEEMKTNPVMELIRITASLAGITLNEKRATEIVNKHSFAQMAGRKAGQENNHSFLRKGIIGDWKNNFSQQAREKFNFYAGDELIKLGYENNDSWVNESQF